MTCPECGNEISDKALTCPKCGYPITTPTVTPADLKVKSESQHNPSKKTTKWKHISWITYLSIGLLFLLPFCDINCSGRKVVSLSGIVLVTGATVSPTILGNKIGESRDIPANLYAILALASIILGFIVSISYPKSNILSGLLGLACAGFLIVLQVSINQKINELEIGSYTASFTIFYWIALIGGVFIALINFSTAQFSNLSINQIGALVALSILSVFTLLIIPFTFDPTTPFTLRPILTTSNSESSSFSSGPSAKELEAKRIADSTRDADSLAMGEEKTKNEPENKASSEKTDEIIGNKVKKVIENYYKYSKYNDYDDLINIFANPIKRYFDQTNVTPEQVTIESKKYAQRFSFLSLDVNYNTLQISANSDRDDFVITYDIQVIVKNLKTNIKTKFNETISLKLNSEYRIYYINEKINSKEILNN